MATEQHSKSVRTTNPQVLDAPPERDAGVLTLDADQASAVREMLLIGLASWGELGRIGDELDALKACGRAAPDELRPIMPDGSSDTVCRFAEAIRSVVPVGRA